MRHEWILDVLRDLREYAQQNGMFALAQQAESALHVAMIEVAGSGPGGGADDGTPPGDKGRPH